MILQDPGKIPGRNLQESGGLLVGSWQEIQEVKRWESLLNKYSTICLST